ncbi:MAG: helix-turn-helix domain-containing protein [Rikenellaceae bacterium]|nr:helix-turn-helix domain-containing protein [Rikenellaceae bacterium]
MKTEVEQWVIDKVRKIRIERRISQAELALKLGVSRGFIGDVENPKKRAKYNLNHINEIALIFDCPMAVFFPEHPILQTWKDED